MTTVVRSAEHGPSWGEQLAPWRIVSNFAQKRHLIWQFTVRDVLGRYRGSYFGLLWSLLRPLCLLAVYGFVFGYIFQSRLGTDPHETKADFALALFVGLIVMDFIGECLGRAPVLILSNTNYVKKVVFPLEILPLSAVAAGVIHLVLSSLPLYLGFYLTHHCLQSTSIYFPLMFIPLVFLGLGVTWFFSSLGVFIRDINSFTPVLTTVIMYVSAIFYRISKVPPSLQPVVIHNPLAVMVDNMRNVFMGWGILDWNQYAVVTAVSMVIMFLGYAFFMRTKSAFADVL
jgi:homopolymeric O-antigen transport system permease protein